MIAPCLAIHGNLPGTLALLLIGLALGLLMAVFGGAAATSETLMSILPFVVTGAIQLVRPLLYAATFGLYEDLWRDEQARRATKGAPAMSAPATLLLRLSRAIPTTTGRLVGCQAAWTL